MLTKEEIAKIRLNAHRGYQPIGSENTVPGFIAAGQRGFAFIETDVWMTRDGHLVCIHENDISHTTNGTGRVSEMTLEEGRQYHIDIETYGSDISGFTKEELRIPLFSEYLQICKQYGSVPFIETKHDFKEKELEHYMKKILAECKVCGFAEEDVVISSLLKEHLRMARQVSAKVFIHSIWVYDSAAEMIADGVTNPIGVSYNIQNLQEKSNYEEAEKKVKEAHDLGAQICLRAGDDMVQVYYMCKLGLDYIPTNTTTPEMLKQHV